MDIVKKEKPASKNKVRKLVHLEPEDTVIIKKLAKSRAVSESEIVRMAVRDLGIREGLIKDPFTKLIGSIKAGKNEAVNHDEVIYE